MEIAIGATDLAESLGSAVALNLLFHIPLQWAIVITAFDVLLLLALLGIGPLSARGADVASTKSFRWNLGEAADIIALHPVALQLRTLQTMTEIATEKYSTIIFPAQFMTTVQEAISTIKQDSSNK